MTTNVLKIERLSYSYTGGNRVLDLEIRRGERVSCLDLPVAGKHLARLMAGLETRCWEYNYTRKSIIGSQDNGSPENERWLSRSERALSSYVG